MKSWREGSGKVWREADYLDKVWREGEGERERL